MLADLHGKPRIVVKLAPVTPGSSRDVHSITGLYYGGVCEDERQAFEDYGATVLETVYPKMQAAMPAGRKAR